MAENTPDLQAVLGDEDPTPMTIERMCAAFDAIGFKYELDDQRMKTGFGDVPMAVYLDAGGDFLVIRGFIWSNLDEHGKAVANAQIAQKHDSTFFPTYFTFSDEDGEQIAGDVNIYVGKGVTDAQLGSYIGLFEMLEKELQELGQAVRAAL